METNNTAATAWLDNASDTYLPDWKDLLYVVQVDPVSILILPFPKPKTKTKQEDRLTFPQLNFCHSTRKEEG